MEKYHFKKLLLRLQDYHIYDNEHFFMVPGSINARKHISINRKTKLMFSSKSIEGDALIKREDGYYRCYYVGMDVYLFPAVSLSKLAETVGFPKKEKQEDTDNCVRMKSGSDSISFGSWGISYFIWGRNLRKCCNI